MKLVLFIILFLSVFRASEINAQSDKFQNPILPGFHPDPSICRVGDDYYLVNSSFEWFPGLPIYHSRDLVNWKLIGYGISRPTQVELPVGLKDSRGIYAPTLRFHNGVYYLITTCVNCKQNFYITATNPAGPWSDPVWLDSRGIDPSLFWDDDGKCYYTGHANISGLNDWPDKNGVWMQELDLTKGKLVGEKVQLTHGHAKNARWTEGPHLYKIDGKYMLMVAEGGTGFHHSVTVHHSDNVWGPYIPNHANPVLTHRDLGKNYPIHSVGHADLIQTQSGDWWAVALAKRQSEGYTLLSRETFLCPIDFEKQDGISTPVFNPGVGKILAEDKRPDLPWTPVAKEAAIDGFSGDALRLAWNFLRTPYTKWYNLKEGELEVQLRPEVLDSLVNPSFIARRIEHLHFKATTKMQFQSKKAGEQAGLAIYRNSDNHFQLVKENNSLVLVKTMKGQRTELNRVACTSEELVLQVEASGVKVVFRYGSSIDELKQIGEVYQLDNVSDELAGGFNGPFIGMYASSNGKVSKSKAVFDWFEYLNLEEPVCTGMTPSSNE